MRNVMMAVLSWLLVAQAQNGAVSVTTGLTEAECNVAAAAVQFHASCPSAAIVGASGVSCIFSTPDNAVMHPECLDAEKPNSLYYTKPH